MPTRATSLAATINGFALGRILSARTTSSWKQQFPDATITVPLVPQNVSTWLASHAYGLGAFVKPTVRNGHVYTATVAGTTAGSQPTWPTGNGATVTDGGVTWTEAGADVVYNDAVVLTMGAGNNVVRFKGLVRKLTYTLFPRAVAIQCFGYLTLVHEYQNIVGNPQYGGQSIFDLTGSATSDDATIVKAVLTQSLASTGVTFTPANIGGTGQVWGTRTDLPRAHVYVWRAAMMPAGDPTISGYGGVGQSALDYIQSWDKVSAVYVDATHASGFYRTYETVNGIYRSLIGGRPRSTNDFTFTEGLDIEANGEGTREFPIANGAYVTGGDFALAGANPVRNVNGSTFVGQSSNPFQPTQPVLYEFSSAFIEFGLEADIVGTAGISCERVGNALLQDLNRETVTVRFRTPRDDVITPGKTMLVRGPGGQPDRLGMGEPLWVDEVTNGVDENGMYYQDLVGTGGGLPDAYTAAPAG